MVSSWFSRAASLVDTRLQAAGLSIPKDTFLGEYAIDVGSLHATLPSLPADIGQRLTDLCGDTFNPVRQVLANDIDTITRVLLELETSYQSQKSSDYNSEAEGSHRTTDPIQSNALPATTMAIGPQERVHKPRVLPKCRQPSAPIPIVIPSTHPAAPTIIINSCGSQNPEATCRVPLQNSAFGKMLTVPMHSSFNGIHPPMSLCTPTASMPALEEWKWGNGHWEVVLPSLEQQARRGMSSKMHATRRRSCRPCSSEN
ncbi:hypothetical protein FA13DRAFT_1724625 [Coprinellus micaceus]|uniref:Uncharacterized protein n=1 Tax=Coprinellus micaceus TaxID=71717 RepID=A0A4Y7TWZ2_COPMI|nr:hypothetical protein FA13DRAFT_1724625 [Coprinellus micaceus]